MLLGPSARRILTLVGRGKTNNQIAKSLGVTKGTIRLHCRQMTKAGLMKYDPKTTKREVLVDLKEVKTYKSGQNCASGLTPGNFMVV